jgi:hypothetical protein
MNDLDIATNAVLATQSQFGLPAYRQLIYRDRTKETVNARHTVWFLMNRAGMPMSRIAKMLNYDRTTVMSGIRKINFQVTTYPFEECSRKIMRSVEDYENRTMNESA